MRRRKGGGEGAPAGVRASHPREVEGGSAEVFDLLLLVVQTAAQVCNQLSAIRQVLRRVLVPQQATHGVQHLQHDLQVVLLGCRNGPAAR